LIEGGAAGTLGVVAVVKPMGNTAWMMVVVL
jgi:hypothetical protein